MSLYAFFYYADLYIIVKYGIFLKKIQFPVQRGANHEATTIVRDTAVRSPITLLHLKVLSNADMLVYYLSQSVQKQQNCGLKCRSRVRLTPTLATLLLSLVTPTHSVCTPQH